MTVQLNRYMYLVKTLIGQWNDPSPVLVRHPASRTVRTLHD